MICLCELYIWWKKGTKHHSRCNHVYPNHSLAFTASPALLRVLLIISPFFFPHRQTWLKSKPQLCRNAQQNPNQWRLCREFHYRTLGWPHASAMSGVILGVLPLRWRNPHWFLIRTCQVSIKEVPSPPLVSIEIRLTNKNSLAALFAQSGLLLLLCV